MSFLKAAFGGSQSVSNLDHWIIRAISGGKTKAGVPVSHYNAVTMPAVWACMTLISDVIGMLPVHVMQKTGNRREVRPDHPAAKLLHDIASPNTDMGESVFTSTLQGHVLGWGNGYAEIQRTGAGKPYALWPLLPDRTKPDIRFNDERRVLRYQTQVEGRNVPIKAGDVLHIRGHSFDGIHGMSPITAARHAIGLGLAMEEFGSKFFANDAKSGGFLQYPGQLSAKAKSNIQDSITEEGEGLDDAHRVKILEEGMKYVPTTVTPEDSQFLESREFQIAEVARMYRVPLVLINSHQKDTAWGTGIEQLMIGFVVWTITPWVSRWEEELSRKLLTQDERDEGYFIKFNVNALLRGDMKTRGEFYTAAYKKWMTADEIREKEDMNPLDEPIDEEDDDSLENQFT